MRHSRFLRILSILTGVTFLSLQPVSFAQDAGSVAAAPAINSMAKNSIPQALSGGLSSQSDLQDHKAVVFNFQGDVRILKHNSEDWQPVAQKMVIEEGDQVLTGAGSYMEVAYDANFLNIARVEEKTKAEFRSIEPTDVYMEDGTVFSALDGLAGSSYQISTPTAVAGVRGTTFDVRFDAQTGALDMNVYKDLSDHIGVVEVLAGENKITVTEGSAWDHETQSIVEVSPQDAAKAESFLVNLENQYGESRSEEILKLNAEADASTQDNSSDDQKAVNNPNDGGDQGGLGDQGTGSENSGNLNRAADASDVDAFVDSLIPPADAVLEQEAGTGTDLMRASKEKASEEEDADGEKASVKTETAGKNSIADGKVDYGKAMEFLSIGGLGSDKKDSGTGLRDFASNVMANFVDPQSAKMFGSFVESYEKMGGGFQEFLTGSPVTNMTDGAMPTLDGKFANMDSGMFEKRMDAFAAGFNPSNTDMNFQDFARIVAENDFNFGTGVEKAGVSAVNPFFSRVLFVLQENLTLTQKSLITVGSDLNISIISAASLDADANQEKLHTITYYKEDGQIHATYESIQDAVVDGGGYLQPDEPGKVYVIDGLDILACGGVVKESGCS